MSNAPKIADRDTVLRRMLATPPKPSRKNAISDSEKTPKAEKPKRKKDSSDKKNV